MRGRLRSGLVCLLLLAAATARAEILFTEDFDRLKPGPVPNHPVNQNKECWSSAGPDEYACKVGEFAKLRFPELMISGAPGVRVAPEADGEGNAWVHETGGGCWSGTRGTYIFFPQQASDDIVFVFRYTIEDHFPQGHPIQSKEFFIGSHTCRGGNGTGDEFGPNFTTHGSPHSHGRFAYFKSYGGGGTRYTLAPRFDDRYGSQEFPAAGSGKRLVPGVPVWIVAEVEGNSAGGKADGSARLRICDAPDLETCRDVFRHRRIPWNDLPGGREECKWDEVGFGYNRCNHAARIAYDDVCVGNDPSTDVAACFEWIQGKREAVTPPPARLAKAKPRTVERPEAKLREAETEPTIGPRGGTRGVEISRLAGRLGVCRADRDRQRWIIGPRRQRRCRGEWFKVNVPVASLRVCGDVSDKGRVEIGTELSGCKRPLTVEFLQTLE